jgi:hypothetical protein
MNQAGKYPRDTPRFNKEIASMTDQSGGQAQFPTYRIRTHTDISQTSARNHNLRQTKISKVPRRPTYSPPPRLNPHHHHLISSQPGIQIPPQSAPPCSGSQLSLGLSMQVNPSSHWIAAMPPHMRGTTQISRQPFGMAMHVWPVGQDLVQGHFAASAVAARSMKEVEMAIEIKVESSFFIFRCLMECCYLCRYLGKEVKRGGYVCFFAI